MCDDADGILATPFIYTQSQYATHKMLITFFFSSEKWNGQHLTISSSPSTPKSSRIFPVPTFEYPFSYLYGLRCCMCVEKNIFRYLTRSPMLGYDGRKMYTTQDKTHTTNGWKNIIFYLIVVYVHGRTFSQSSQWDMDGIGRKYTKKCYVWQDIT